MSKKNTSCLNPVVKTFSVHLKGRVIISNHPKYDLISAISSAVNYFNLRYLISSQILSVSTCHIQCRAPVDRVPDGTTTLVGFLVEIHPSSVKLNWMGIAGE